MLAPALERPRLVIATPPVPDFVAELWRAEAAAAEAYAGYVMPERRREELLYAAQGQKVYETAEERFYSYSGIRSLRHRAIRDVGARCVAQAYNRAVLAGIYEVEPRDDLAAELSELELVDLALGAIGLTNTQIYDAQPQTSEADIKEARTTMKAKLGGAQNVAHAVYNAHAAGILPLAV